MIVAHSAKKADSGGAVRFRDFKSPLEVFRLAKIRHIQAGEHGESHRLNVFEDAISHPIDRLKIEGLIGHRADGIERPRFPSFAEIFFLPDAELGKTAAVITFPCP